LNCFHKATVDDELFVLHKKRKDLNEPLISCVAALKNNFVSVADSDAQKNGAPEKHTEMESSAWVG
jgi:hypothetical protein